MAAALGLVSIPAAAAGLGQLVVDSPLGEPLRAYVEIVGLPPGEEASVQVRVASRAAHTRAGIEYPATLGEIRIALERRDGGAVASISGTRAFELPAVNFILEMVSSSGSLMRQDALLPNPAASSAVPAPAVQAPAIAEAAPRPGFGHSR